MGAELKEKLLKELQIGLGRPRPVKAPHGTELHCRGWHQEAALRMLLNNLDPDTGEKPDELIVYGGLGKAARNWPCFDALVRSLLDLENDETLLVGSGKPVGILRTHAHAPRVLIANANIVPRWATWEYFHELDKKGLIMFGQMTAGSWIYIGTQGILQGTYETFAALAERHFGSDLKNRIVLTAGLGGMGGAQPLSVTLNNGVALCVEVDRDRIERRLATKYLDVMTEDPDRAILKAREAAEAGRPLSIGLLGNAAEVLPEMVKKGFNPDVVTDQTSAHDELNGYVPAGLPYDQALALRKSDPKKYMDLAFDSMAVHVRAILEMKDRGAVAFDYGNNLRTQAMKRGVDRGHGVSRFCAGLYPAFVLRGRGSFPLGGLERRPAGHPGHGRSLDRGFSGKDPHGAVAEDGR